MVRELKSGDLCAIGSDAYSDPRDELLPMEECESTRTDYGEKVGLPVDNVAFIAHVRTMLTEAAQQADKTYHDNPYFKIINGRPKLGRQEKKPIPSGFKELDAALRRKLDSLELSLLDVLADTMQWIGWGKYFGPLSGHQGKLHEEDRRKILTVFAYGTGLGPTQIADVSARQVSFVNQRQVTTEKLEAAIGTASMRTINFNCRTIGATQSVRRPTERNGICTKIICYQSVISVTAATVALPITTSATRISRCSRISFPVASGKPCTSWMGSPKTRRISSPIPCMAIPRRKARRSMGWRFYWASS